MSPYNRDMRTSLRAASVLLSLLLAVFTPFVLSGYLELRKAESASSHLEAAEHYRAAARRIFWRADLYELAGHYFYHAGEYTRADAAYQRAFDRRALSPEGWVAWGDVNYLNGDPERAEALWEQGLAEPHPSENLLTRLAEMAQQDKAYEKAALYLRRYVENHAEDASARYRLGLLLTLSDPDEALSQLLHASQLDPEFDPATQSLRTALNLSALSETPSQGKVVIGRGLGLVAAWDLALAAFHQAVELDETNAEAWAWLAEAEQKSAGEEVFVHLQRALELNPDSPVVRGLRGLYFQRTGNYGQALIEFQAAAKLEPEEPAWYISIGEAYAAYGDLILALQAYQYATMLAPENASYWRLLAEFCARYHANIRDVGLPAARQALLLTPDDPQALDMLGWLLVLDGRYYEAERILLRSLEANPELASVHYHLALLYLQTDDPSAMFLHLSRASELGSEEAGMLLKSYFP